MESAEKKLAELYELEKPILAGDGVTWEVNIGSTYLGAEQIDLIANLVVERMEKRVEHLLGGKT